MKFLFFTDMHIKGVNPGKRKDVFYLTILKKLMEIGHVIKNENINFVMIGGDLFDLPKVSNQLLGEVAKIMKSWKVKVFVVPGNHDVYGQNISTLPHTSLGILERTGVVTILTRDVSPLYIGKRNDPDYPLVAFTGQEYYQEIDTGVNNDYEVEHSVADVNILVAHGMLLEKPFHPDIPYTLMKDVRSGADLILSGHYHPDEVDKEYSGIRFIKPRGAARLEATKHNIDHMPQYVIVKVLKSNGVVTLDSYVRDFTWAPQGCDIFDYAGQVESKLYKNRLGEFKNQIRSIDLTNTVDLPGMVKKIASSDTGVEFEHIELALRYLMASEKGSTDKTLDGYVPCGTSIAIDEVEIVNFQSHKSTVLKFKDCALNALVGESNNGKTAIMRAIIWCLYNEPKGTDYIKEGEKFSSVTITMSNGTKITRRRTNSETGYFEVTDAAGKATKYSKFGTNVPIEIYNAHQMPKVLIAKENMSLNVSAQLDGPFMLSFSASDRASAIGKLTKTDVVDNAILAVSKEIVNHQKDIKVLERDVVSLNEKIAKYDFLEEEEKKLAHIEYIMNEADNHTAIGTKYANLRKEYNDSIVNTNMLNLKVAALPDTDKVTVLLDGIVDGMKLMARYMEDDVTYKTTLVDIETATTIIANTPDTAHVEALMQQIELSAKRANTLKNLDDQLKRVDVSIAGGNKYVGEINIVEDSLISEIEQKMKQLDELETKRAEYNALLGAKSEAEKRIAQEIAYIEKMNKIEAECKENYKTCLIEAGTCPVCGNHMDENSSFDL